MDAGTNFLSKSKACKHFGVSGDTLIRWAKEGLITFYRTKPGITGHKRYDVSSFKGLDSSAKPEIVRNDSGLEEKGICYCRVSTRVQANDLKRQIASMQEKFPSFRIVKDYGSGINFKRKGLLSILKDAIEGNITTVVVSHRDRLTRFGFELFQWLFDQYRVKLVVLEESTGSNEDELCKDLLAVVHDFSSRANGGRRYTRKKEEADEKEAGED